MQAWTVGGYEHQLLNAGIIDHRGGNALGIQGAGGVELATVDAQAIAVAAQAGGAVVGGLGAQLGQCVAEASARQDFSVETLLLLGRAVYPQHFQGIEMVLRNLAQGGVGLGNTRDDLGQGHVGYASAAKGLGHADAPQAGAGEQLEFGVGQQAFAVALGAVALQLLGEVLGDGQSLGIAGDDRRLGVGWVSAFMCFSSADRRGCSVPHRRLSPALQVQCRCWRRLTQIRE